MNRVLARLTLAALCLLLAACVNQTLKSTSVPSVNTAARQLQETQLLDVGVVIFDPGLEGKASKDEPSYPEVRRAEARYMPYVLREAI